MKTRILVACLLCLLAGCCPQDPPKPDTTIYPAADPSMWKRVEWNGHVYICHSWGHQGGMVHDPDCPFCKEAKMEED